MENRRMGPLRMWTFCGLCCVCGLGRCEEPSTEPTQVPLGELRQQVGEALRAEAVSAREGDNPAEVARLVDVWLALAGDPRRDESLLIQKLGQRVRGRLLKVKRKVAKIERPPTTTLAQQGAGGGGAGGPGPGAAAAAQRVVDYGPELVDLIERVISPEVWDVNGGPASIAFYAPGRALVVRAPGEVHHQVGRLVEDLRAAGGP